MNAAPFDVHEPVAGCQADPNLHSYLVSDSDGLRRLRAAWNELKVASIDGNPFTQWDWVWNWWKLFGGSKSLLDHRLFVIVMHDGSVVRAIFPFVLSSAGIGRAGVRNLHLYGFTGGFTEMRAPLVWPGWETQAAQLLLTVLWQKRALYDWCSIDGIPADNPLGHFLYERAEKEGWITSPPIPDYILPLPHTWEELRCGLKRNIKESIRHCYNSLAREGHEWEFQVIADTHRLPGAVNEFFRLHGERADMPGTVPHPNYFATPRRKLFLQRLARDLSAQERFMVALLRVDGKVVATRILLAADDCLYLYFSGFDPEWKRYSVTTTVTTECIKAAIRMGFRAVNLSTGKDVSKTRWSPQVVRHFGLRMPSPTLMGRTLFTLRKRLPMAKFKMPVSDITTSTPGGR